LRLGAVVEVLAGDAVAVVEAIDALESRHVEEHAAADHLALGLSMPHFCAPAELTSRQS